NLKMGRKALGYLVAAIALQGFQQLNYRMQAVGRHVLGQIGHFLVRIGPQNYFRALLMQQPLRGGVKGLGKLENAPRALYEPMLDAINIGLTDTGQLAEFGLGEIARLTASDNTPSQVGINHFRLAHGGRKASET